MLFRAEDGRCPEGTAGSGSRQQCARLGFHWPVGTPARRGTDLAVPDPCAAPLIGYHAVGNTWHYALCSARGGQPRTTLYAIELEPRYAHAEEGLVGCEPLGLAPYEDGVVALGRCSDGLAGLVLRQGGQVVEVWTGATPSARCEQERPVLTMQTREGTKRLALTGPRDRLSGWLPETIAPRGSQAMWTGEALLVAVPGTGDVSFRRYQCRFERLDRTDLL